MAEKEIIKTRPPIVTILGHVDHGKTTLLDKIRKTDVAAGEAGGITQRIGASVVTTKEDLPAQASLPASAGKRITFIDTPGHAAFTQMRSRGAKVADLAVLVVAADDGVQPQTKESLSLIKEADVPFIVAFTKTDLASASIEQAQAQLEKEGVVFEGRGGDVPWLGVSGKTGEGVEGLLELIILLAEVKGVTGDPEGKLEAIVIETQKGKAGPLASVVVRNGTLKVGQNIVSTNVSTKVRGIFDDKGKSVKHIGPGEPGQILGFEELPPIGAIIEIQRETEKTSSLERGKPKVSQKFNENQILLMIKTESAGSLEAVLASLPQEVAVITSGVGEVNESDVLDAKSNKALIIAFVSKIAPAAKKLAEVEGVAVERFEIIYELLQRIEEIIKGEKQLVLGKAEIIANFPFDNKKIAGCRVLQGKITKTDSLIILRGEQELGQVKAVSMKKLKQEINEAKPGEEFGLLFEPQLDFAIGDVLVSVQKNG